MSSMPVRTAGSMKRAARVLLGALVILAILGTVVGAEDVYVEVNPVSADTSKSIVYYSIFHGDALRFDKYNFAEVRYFSYQLVEPYITSAGCEVRGFLYDPPVGPGRLEVSFTNSALHGTIFFTGRLPANSRFSVAGSTFTWSGVAINLGSLVLNQNATVILRDIQFQPGPVAPVLLGDTSSRLSITSGGGLFILGLSAESRMSLVFAPAYGTVRVVGGSKLAIDASTCLSCVDGVVSFSAGLNVEDGSLFRMSQITVKGSTSYLWSTPFMSVSNQSLALFSDIKLESSAFLAMPAQVVISSASTYSMINVKMRTLYMIQRGWAKLPSSLEGSTVRSYGQQCTLGTTELSSVGAYNTVGISITDVLDSKGCGSDRKCRPATCVPRALRQSLVAQDECFCPCSAGTMAPQCVSVYDPISWYHACDDPNCISCYRPFTCDTCAKGYIYSEVSLRCIRECNSASMPGCLDCSGADGKCRICKIGYLLVTSNNPCTKCAVPNCGDCMTGADGCRRCISGYYLNPAPLTQDKICLREDECRVAHCDRCELRQPSVCVACEVGYYLTAQKQCEVDLNPPPPCKVPNCMTCMSFSNYQCARCSRGYMEKDLECVLDPRSKL